ncbi:MAG: hypothetical protein ABIO70_23975 [Pseudomonadota bacterium]
MHIPRPALALAALAGSCAFPAGRYPLEGLAESEVGRGNYVYSAKVTLDHRLTEGWDLILDMVVWTERETPMVDLSRVLIRADGTAWDSCHLPPGDDPSTLRFRLEEEERLPLILRCVGIRRPEQRLEVRVPISGTGNKGYVDLVFAGVRTSGDPDLLD